MESFYGTKIFIRFFLALLILLSITLVGCKDAELDRPETSSIRIKGGKEILVVRDLAGYPPLWCGNTRLIYSMSPHPDSTRGEIFQYDVETGLHTTIAKPSWPKGCTGDGEWLVYSDNNSYRQEKGNPEHGVIDLWRYEFKTKRHQRIVMAPEPEVSMIGDILSPTGFKLYLGRKPGESVEMPEPEWEIIWSRSKMSFEAWLPDLSGILQTHYTRKDRAYRLALELFDPEKEQIIFEPPLDGSVRDFQMLDQNSFYMKMYRKRQGFERFEKEPVVSCEINRSEASISCVDVLELKQDVLRYKLLSDGETIIFTKQGDQCVRIKYKGESEARCITTTDYGSGYDLKISPDEKWMAFTVLRKRENEGTYTEDLYIAELIYY